MEMMIQRERGRGRPVPGDGGGGHRGRGEERVPRDGGHCGADTGREYLILFSMAYSNYL